MNEELAELSPKSSRLQFLPIFQKFRGKKNLPYNYIKVNPRRPNHVSEKKIIEFFQKSG